MKFLSQTLRVGYFFVLIQLINSYLLIAANLNDFRTIAEKLIPEDIAEKLTRVASNTKLENLDTSYENNDYEKSDNIEENNHSNVKVKAYEKTRANFDIKGKKVNFDELVERVKKRLEDELKNKYVENKQSDKETRTDIKKREYTIITNEKSDKIKNNKLTTSKISEIYEEKVYDNLDYMEAVPEKPKSVQNVIKYTTKDNRYEYADAMTDSEAEAGRPFDKKQEKTKDKVYYDYETVTQNDLYKKIDMIKKDSYEDYKIPEKENIYSSSENHGNKRFKIQHPSKLPRKAKHGYKHVSNIKQSEEILAVTEDLLNDYNDTEIISDVDEIEKNKKAKDNKLGTMIPKRELYTIITPNYFDKVPNVVEKYNFNEPIPERDQEREVLKYYGNPPARVNKKVRLL